MAQMNDSPIGYFRVAQVQTSQIDHPFQVRETRILDPGPRENKPC